MPSPRVVQILLAILGVVILINLVLEFGIDDSSILTRFQDDKVFREDLNILKEKEPPIDKFTESLIRLAQKREKTARYVALRKEKSKNEKYRAVAASAAGYFNDETSLGVVERLLKDPSEAVRVAAVTALSRDYGPKRKKLAHDFLMRSALSPLEMSAGLLTVFTLSQDLGERNQTLQNLAKFSLSGRTKLHLDSRRRLFVLAEGFDPGFEVVKSSLAIPQMRQEAIVALCRWTKNPHDFGRKAKNHLQAWVGSPATVCGKDR